MASTMYGFEAKRKHKTPKDGKLNGLHNGYLGFWKSLVFDPQNENFHFSKLNSYNIKISADIQTTEYLKQNCIATTS